MWLRPLALGLAPDRLVALHVGTGHVFTYDSLMIHLIGPGGAGKSTAAPHVGAIVGWPVFDLDRLFEAAYGDIDRFIGAHGYAAYAAANVATYLATCRRAPAVWAVSSGFMLYAGDVHPAVSELQRRIAAAATTVLLLPSTALETCVAETLRRQRIRPLPARRSVAREEAVIRERFPRYRRLTSRVVTTMRPPEEVAREIVAQVGGALASEV